MHNMWQRLLSYEINMIMEWLCNVQNHTNFMCAPQLLYTSMVMLTFDAESCAQFQCFFSLYISFDSTQQNVKCIPFWSEISET